EGSEAIRPRGPARAERAPESRPRGGRSWTEERSDVGSEAIRPRGPARAERPRSRGSWAVRGSGGGQEAGGGGPGGVADQLGEAGDPSASPDPQDGPLRHVADEVRADPGAEQGGPHDRPARLLALADLQRVHAGRLHPAARLDPQPQRMTAQVETGGRP